MYLARRPQGRWELRQSHTSEKGPRSRTLVTFRELDAAAMARVTERVGVQDAARVRRLCRRAGAPVTARPADAAGEMLLAAVGRGERPRGALLRVLADELGIEHGVASDAERAAARWVGATMKERAATLRDLLLLSDRLPAPGRTPLTYPPIKSDR